MQRMIYSVSLSFRALAVRRPIVSSTTETDCHIQKPAVYSTTASWVALPPFRRAPEIIRSRGASADICNA